MKDTTIRSAKSQSGRYYYHDNLYGIYHQFDTLDEAKLHAIANNRGTICIFRSATNTHVCTVKGGTVTFWRV